jgi:5-methylcytosine-specific restriction endonuclease McrA
MAENGEKRDPVTHRTPTQIRREIKKRSTPAEVAKRVQRNQARAKLMKAGKVRKGDGMDVDHKTPIRHGGSNAASNLRVVPASKNRGWREK